MLASLIAESTVSGEVLDIYEAAGMPKPSLSDLNPDFITKAQQARNPHLAIEALRKLVAEESAKVTRNNVVRQRAFSERVTELMTQVHQPAADVGAGDRRAGRDGARRSRRKAAAVPASRRRWTTTSSPSTTRSPRTSRR